jgi:predicted TIM-barrel fold metal-dependent hydrolase
MTNGIWEGPDSEIKHVCIDTHLHMCDFLHKSSGTNKILQAMDGCGTEKAVLIGMPCCKKWSKDEPEKPLYYQDDNGQCYYYAYSDQMVADAWMALPDDKRARFAPVMGAFNPTDNNAIDHVQRMWDKYPGLWRGLGEVMCRHDDLTMLLQDDETPVVNHMAMRPLYQFCIKHDLNCMMHHNADRTFKRKQDGYAYVWEVEEVLDTFPDLRLIWCHAGVSRRTHQDDHCEMIEKLCDKYKNFYADISWCVWEDVICEPGKPKPKDCWVKLFEKHPTRFTMGSDQVGQFIGPVGHNYLKPEIVKFWALGEYCTPATAKAILYDNAERLWFEGWKRPQTDGDDPRFRQIPPCMRVETLMMNQGYFQFDGEYY